MLRLGTHASATKPGSESRGLTKEVAAERLESQGKNEIQRGRKHSAFTNFLECLSNLFNLLLISGGLAYILLWLFDPLENFSSVSLFCVPIFVSWTTSKF